MPSIPSLCRTLALALLMAFSLVSSADAGKMMFGKDESLTSIGEPFEVPGEGRFSLGHKVTKTFFIAGVWVTDDGYVLLPEGSSGRYITLTDGMKSELQAAKLLPDPLPGYSLSTWDYLFGYSLWIVMAGVGLWTVVEEKLKKA